MSGGRVSGGRGATASPGPIHRPVDVRSLPAKGYVERIEATEEERRALARANGLPDVPRFQAFVRVLPWGSDGVRVTGTIEAEVVQECVVSLEQLDARIEEVIETVLVPDGSPLARMEEGEVVLDADGEDPPETFTPPIVDVGALAAEFFALALDPYPRAPDAELPVEASDAEANPFAALAGLKVGDG